MAGHLAFHTEVVNVICEVIKIHNKSPIGLYARSIFTGPKYLIDVCIHACMHPIYLQIFTQPTFIMPIQMTGGQVR